MSKKSLKKLLMGSSRSNLIISDFSEESNQRRRRVKRRVRKERRERKARNYRERSRQPGIQLMICSITWSSRG